MSKPIPGRTYIVTEDDLIGPSNSEILNRIAQTAFGEASRSADIEKANQIQKIGVGTVFT